MDAKNIRYLILTIVLLILSGLEVFSIFKINNSPLDLFLPPAQIATPTQIPLPSPTQKPTITITPTTTSTAKITITPTATPTATPTTKTTINPTPTPIPISGQSTFKNSEDAFSINYSSSRKLYQDKESTGNRYTFYNSSGNFAVHVSPSGTWAWTNSDRNFSNNLIISGQNTFRYDISTQTIVDLQSSTKNYTLQCIHNGNESIKAECETFIKSFQIL